MHGHRYGEKRYGLLIDANVEFRLSNKTTAT